LSCPAIGVQVFISAQSNLIELNKKKSICPHESIRIEKFYVDRTALLSTLRQSHCHIGDVLSLSSQPHGLLLSH